MLTIIWRTQHGESQFNLEGKIGGDSLLSPRGMQYAEALPALIRDNIGDAPLTVHLALAWRYQWSWYLSFLKVWTSTLRRTIQTASKLDYPKLTWKSLDELDAGKFVYRSLWVAWLSDLREQVFATAWHTRQEFSAFLPFIIPIRILTGNRGQLDRLLQSIHGVVLTESCIASIPRWLCESWWGQVQLPISWWRVVSWCCCSTRTYHYGTWATREYRNCFASGRIVVLKIKFWFIY